MAADDDLDELEAQLDDYDYDDDEEDSSPLKRVLKKHKFVIIPVAVLIPVLIIAAALSGGDTETVGDLKMIVVPELAVKPGQPVKMAPDQPGGEQVPGQENGVYNMVTTGENEGKIAKITPPPEDPKNPPADGKAPDAGEAVIAMVPEGAEKTPKNGKSADGTMIPPPTPPAKDGDAVLPDLPAPTGPTSGDGKVAESILPVPPTDGKTPEAKTPEVKAPEAKAPDKPEVVAVQPVQPAPPPTTTPKVNNNQIAVVIPKPTAATVPPPSPPPGNTKVTPLRTMAGVYRVQVASARSESAAKTLWDKQVNKHPDVLGQLPLTVQAAVIQDRGTFFRVQGGAFGDREAADSVCRKLKSRGQDCLVVRP